MTFDQMIVLISSVGFPIASAIGLGYALHRFLSMLADAHLKTIERVARSLEAQETAIASIKDELSELAYHIKGKGRRDDDA